ncbi:MAG: hypothetical protein ABIN69_12255 [Aestuariivirga sp.]
MIKRPTVIVVGAGASFSLEFPLGIGLVTSISQKLKFGRDWQGRIEGDQRLFQSMRLATESLGVSDDELFEQSIEISEGLALAESIDNYVHTHQGNLLVPIISKLAIGLFILDAEYKCDLRTGHSFKSSKIPPQFWVSSFCRLHFTKSISGQLDEIFDNVAIVCFNYDRNIQRSIQIGLANYFRLSDSDATNLTAKLRVFHPYGSLGEILTSNKLPYGTAPTAESIFQSSKGIRTFTEGPMSAKFSTDVSGLLEWAQSIAFLGFGFGRLNMDALGNVPRTGNIKKVFGTALGMSEPNRTNLDWSLENQFRASNSKPLVSCKAEDLLQHFSMELFD